MILLKLSDTNKLVNHQCDIPTISSCILTHPYEISTVFVFYR